MKTNNDYTELELLKIFYESVPLYEDSVGLKYPEILLSKDRGNLTLMSISYPLVIRSSPYGLSTFSTSFDDYFAYRYKGFCRDYKGYHMCLIFSKEGITFEGTRDGSVSSPNYYVFRFLYSNICKLQDFISNQGRGLSKIFDIN